jgi:hypothetical protein
MCSVADYPPRRGGRGWLWDLWWTESGSGAGFLRVLQHTQIIILPSTPHSYIVRGWYNGPIYGRCSKCTQSYLIPRTLKRSVWYFWEISLRMLWDDLPLLSQALGGCRAESWCLWQQGSLFRTSLLLFWGCGPPHGEIFASLPHLINICSLNRKRIIFKL